LQDTPSSEASASDAGPAPTAKELPLSRWQRFGLLTLLQGGIQAISIATGFLLIRWLTKTEFAWYTLGNSSTAVFTTLVDPGTGLGMQSVGGKVAAEPARFRQALASVLSLRWRLGWVAALLALPLPLWFLLENEAPLPIALAILGANVLGFFTVLTNGTLSAALKLQGRFRQALLSDFATVIARLLLVGAAALFWLDAITATLAAVSATAWQYLILRNASAEWRREQPQPSPDDQAQLLQQVRSMRFYNLFQFVQGQVAVWLLSITANVAAVADFGALGRLGSVFAALALLYYQLVIPILSRSQTPQILTRRLGVSVAAYAAAVVASTVAGWLAADWILWLFGSSYAHLTREVPWMIVHLGLYSFTVILWWFNTSRGWVRLARLNPPLTALAQFAAFLTFRPDSVLEVIWFSMISLTPTIALGMAALIGGMKSMNGRAHTDE
jgi:O-antigen/teichoic acid export membrane protein